MPQQVVLNLDQMDDPVIGDGTSSFAGGMVSNDQANLIAENESSLMINCDRDRAGRIVTRKGSVLVGGGPVPGGGSIIQGMSFFWEGIYKYWVVASAGKLWRENDVGGWSQIATGGVPDNADIEVYKLGTINGTLAVGAVTIPVAGLTGPVANGDIFTLQKDIGFEYTVTGHTETGGNTTQVTIAAPGLVVAAASGDVGPFQRLGAKTNGAAAGGAATITIDGITGVLANSDWVVIKGERIIHVITAHSRPAAKTTSVHTTP